MAAVTTTANLTKKMADRPAKRWQMDEDPIAALSSGAGRAALAVIRLSGNDCHKLLKPLLSTSKTVPRQLVLCDFFDPKSRKVIDRPMVVFFSSPKSYTGQESCEIYCHGGPYIVKTILAALYEAGFRPAEPGEFTRRAFLAGKMDLTSAEGVKALTEAESHGQWIAANQLASGKLADSINELRALLVDAMAHLEASIDFPEEEDVEVNLDETSSRVKRVEDAVNRLISSYEDGKVASRGLLVALAGEPNAGKSTLLNTLLEKERAIVTDEAGTTRDYIEESCLISGRLVRLIDTAGLRSKATGVEKIGIDQAKTLIKKADLVLYLAPSDGDLTKINSWISEDRPSKHIVLLTKLDLSSPKWAEDLTKISCKTSEGISELKQLLSNAVDTHICRVKEDVFVTNTRHLDSLNRTKSALEKFFSAKSCGQYDECLAFELQNAAKSLTSIIGDIETEDLLDTIFNTFCIGK